MPNILLTTKCNRSCPYCFAKSEMDGSAGELMSWENIVYLADFLTRSGERKVSLLGGEPTLHPDFIDIVCYLVERNFEVNVFTNGLLPEGKLAELEKAAASISPRQLNFVCNLNDPEQTAAPEAETRSIHRFLALLGPKVGPGFNIYRLDFSLNFLCDLVIRFGLRRTLRLGMTHPLPGQGNSFIRPDQMGLVIERLHSHKPLLDRLRIKPGLDCGFPVCRFTDEQLGWLNRLSGHGKFECGPAIDITPDMSVYSCFPLSSFHRRSIFEFDDLKQVADHFMHKHSLLRQELPGIYDECDGCAHRNEGTCSGGGVCQLLHRFHGEARIRMPDVENELRKDRLPV